MNDIWANFPLENYKSVENFQISLISSSYRYYRPWYTQNECEFTTIDCPTAKISIWTNSWCLLLFKMLSTNLSWVNFSRLNHCLSFPIQHEYQSDGCWTVLLSLTIIYKWKILHNLGISITGKFYPGGVKMVHNLLCVKQINFCSYFYGYFYGTA